MVSNLRATVDLVADVHDERVSQPLEQLPKDLGVVHHDALSVQTMPAQGHGTIVCLQLLDVAVIALSHLADEYSCFTSVAPAWVGGMVNVHLSAWPSMA